MLVGQLTLHTFTLMMVACAVLCVVLCALWYCISVVQVAQRCEHCDAEAVLLQAGAVNRQQDSWQGFSSQQQLL